MMATWTCVSLWICIAIGTALACDGWYQLRKNFLHTEKILLLCHFRKIFRGNSSSAEVNDWEQLAGLLDLRQSKLHDIHVVCKGELLTCYHRRVVRSYCEMTSKSEIEVNSDIGYILEMKMKLVETAHKLRALSFSKYHQSRVYFS